MSVLNVCEWLLAATGQAPLKEHARVYTKNVQRLLLPIEAKIEFQKLELP